MTSKLAKVATIHRTSLDLPDVVKRLRKLIQEMKLSIMNSLDEIQVDKHNTIHLKNAVNKIIQYGNILNLELGVSPTPVEQIESDDIQTIRKLLLDHDIDFSNLTDDERERCEYYIRNDIFVNTYPIKA